MHALHDALLADLPAVLERPGFKLFLVHGSEQCLTLTNDPGVAIGVILVWTGEASRTGEARLPSVPDNATVTLHDPPFPLTGIRLMTLLKTLALIVSLVLAGAAQAEEKITVAAAADLKFAMDEMIDAFERANPGDQVDAVYGSSGKFRTQIEQGAPYDLFFSADIAYPRALAAAGFAASETRPYALGRLVLWSPVLDAGQMKLADLAAPGIKRIAIANPKHAPYGKRAEEALRAAGVWDKVAGKLVLGENIAQTAQFVQTGNAQVGLIALSLALNPELAGKGRYALIPDNLHQPLEQGFIVTKRAASNGLAKRFADYMGKAEASAIMVRYGFVLPAGTVGK